MKNLLYLFVILLVACQTETEQKAEISDSNTNVIIENSGGVLVYPDSLRTTLDTIIFLIRNDKVVSGELITRVQDMEILGEGYSKLLYCPRVIVKGKADKFGLIFCMMGGFMNPSTCELCVFNGDDSLINSELIMYKSYITTDYEILYDSIICLVEKSPLIDSLTNEIIEYLYEPKGCYIINEEGKLEETDYKEPE